MPILCPRLFEDFVGAEHAGVKLHGALQFVAQGINIFAAGLVVQTVKALFGKFARVFRQLFPIALFVDESNHAVARRFAEHHQIQQRVRTQTVRAVYGRTSTFARRVQTFYHHFGIISFGNNDFAQVVGGNAAHHVVRGRHNGNRVFNRVDAGKLNGNFANARQFGFDFFRADVVDFQQNVVFFARSRDLRRFPSPSRGTPHRGKPSL